MSIVLGRASLGRHFAGRGDVIGVAIDVEVSIPSVIVTADSIGVTVEASAVAVDVSVSDPGVVVESDVDAVSVTVESSSVDVDVEV